MLRTAYGLDRRQTLRITRVIVQEVKKVARHAKIQENIYFLAVRPQEHVDSVVHVAQLPVKHTCNGWVCRP
jgi:hypothetical protein